jgi:HPt (histidine-containing phosphotransfer) domain-containing protein
MPDRPDGVTSTSDGRPVSVDFHHLETYVAGDLGLAREVLGLFCEQARSVLPTLDPAAPNTAWREAAHSLKGSALAIGAFALAEACSRAELARDASIEVKQDARTGVADALGQALTDIAIYLRG